MLNKSQRIPRKLFTPILESKRFFNTKNLVLRVADYKEGAKFAASVSKKVSKSAVVRNTIRRRIYSAISTVKPSFKSGLYLFSAKNKTSFEEVLAEVRHLLKPFERE